MRRAKFPSRIVRIILFGMLSASPVVQPARVSGATLPADVSAMVQAAEHQFDTGNYSVAMRTLQSAISQNPLSPEAHYWLARCYYEGRDFDNAIAYAQKAVDLDGKNSVYHQWLARAYGGKADRERSFFLAKKVKKELADAVRLNPSNIEARRDLEDFCIDAPWIVGGSKDEAREQVEAIAALDPIEGHLARAKFDLDVLKRPDLVESEFRLILNAKPTRIEPYLEAAAFFRMGINRRRWRRLSRQRHKSVLPTPDLPFIEELPWLSPRPRRSTRRNI